MRDFYIRIENKYKHIILHALLGVLSSGVDSAWGVMMYPSARRAAGVRTQPSGTAEAAGQPAGGFVFQQENGSIPTTPAAQYLAQIIGKLAEQLGLETVRGGTRCAPRARAIPQVSAVPAGPCVSAAHAQTYAAPLPPPTYALTVFEAYPLTVSQRSPMYPVPSIRHQTFSSLPIKAVPEEGALKTLGVIQNFSSFLCEHWGCHLNDDQVLFILDMTQPTISRQQFLEGQFSEQRSLKKSPLLHCQDIRRGLLHSFSNRLGIDPVRLVQAINTYHLSDLSETCTRPLKYLFLLRAHLENALARAREDVSVLTMASPQTALSGPRRGAVQSQEREDWEARLVRPAYHRPKDGGARPAQRLQNRVEEIKNLQKLVGSLPLLVLRMQQLERFTAQASQKENWDYLLILAELSVNTEAELSQLFPMSVSGGAAESRDYTKIGKNLRLGGFGKASNPPNIRANFLKFLESFADEMALDAAGVAQLAQLADQLQPDVSELLPPETTERAEPLPTYGPQIKLTDFYPTRKRPPLTRWYPFSRPWAHKSACTLQPHVVAFSTREEEGDFDYYHVGLSAQMSLDPDLIARPQRFLERIPILLSGLNMTASPLYYADCQKQWMRVEENPAALSCIEILNNWSPQAKEGETRRTTTTGMTVEGQITQSGMQPGGSMGVSFSLEHATERATPDISIFPHVGRACASWQFRYNNLHASASRGNDCARSTVTPFVQWVWKIPKDLGENMIYTHIPVVPPAVTTTSGYYFNFQAQLQAALKEVLTIPLLQKSIESRELVVNLMNGLQDGHVISIPVPPRLPPGRATTKVAPLRSSQSDGSAA